MWRVIFSQSTLSVDFSIIYLPKTGAHIYISLVQFTDNIVEVDWRTLLIGLLEDIVVHLGLLFNQIGGKQSVCRLAQSQRLFDVCPHCLPFHIVLPLFSLVTLVVHMVQILIHSLLVLDLETFLTGSLFGVELTCFHVLSLDLSGDKGATLPALLVALLQRDETVRIRVLESAWAIEAVVCEGGSWHKLGTTLHKLVN